ncbi:hypothetical protein [Nocardia sp. NPDC019302]|uniref:hypothetical protein n=1 Tax=Nocardia sp. NPDC019302 TaxID=3154592 RepID=UPI0033E71A0E
MNHPEQAVLDAIAGLESDEIGELVRWQIEEGRKREREPLSRWELMRDPVTAADMHRMCAEIRRLRELVGEPPDKPIALNQGDRVGWIDADGNVGVGVVESHEETAPGVWTTTIGDPWLHEDSSSSP